MLAGGWGRGAIVTKDGFMYFNYLLMYNYKCGAVVESQTGSPEIVGSSPTCVV
jgi:hypothetical protein